MNITKKIAEFFIYIAASFFIVAKSINYSVTTDYMAYFTKCFLEEHVREIEVNVDGNVQKVVPTDFLISKTKDAPGEGGEQ